MSQLLVFTKQNDCIFSTQKKKQFYWRELLYLESGLQTPLEHFVYGMKMLIYEKQQPAFMWLDDLKTQQILLGLKVFQQSTTVPNF
jgi:hypothetical protein